VSIPLAFLRDLQNAYLPDTCTIQRGTEGTPTGDGTPVTWADFATGVACRVSIASQTGTEGLGGGDGLRAVNDWTIWLPALQDVTVKDRIVYSGRTFEIARVGARSYETVRECICREVT
jgi:head-tail adaptor